MQINEALYFYIFKMKYLGLSLKILFFQLFSDEKF